MESKIQIRCLMESPRGWVDFIKTINKHIQQGYLISESEKAGECVVLTPGLKLVTMVKSDATEDEVEKEFTPNKDNTVSSQEDNMGANHAEFIKSNEKLSHKDKEGRLAALSKKGELLGFAEEEGIEIPEDAKYPTQIKKFLEETISPKTEEPESEESEEDKSEE